MELVPETQASSQPSWNQRKQGEMTGISAQITSEVPLHPQPCLSSAPYFLSSSSGPKATLISEFSSFLAENK